MQNISFTRIELINLVDTLQTMVDKIENTMTTEQCQQSGLYQLQLTIDELVEKLY